ncbi:phosphopantetheine-binding protein [Nocardiopsis alba]|uniref:phosphopantetheine-binding protein n=1 Tax=Nocardiopsis alba TaxID=53437 RepID=UPI0035DB5DAF
MYDEMREFVIGALEEMSFPTDDLADDSLLGPDDLGMDSLAFAEVIVQVEERYDVRFGQDEAGGPTDISLASFVERLVKSVEIAKAEAA